jgi:hypothetical protein
VNGRTLSAFIDRNLRSYVESVRGKRKVKGEKECVGSGPGVRVRARKGRG